MVLRIDGRWLPAGAFLLALLFAPLVVGALALAADWLILRRVNYHPESTIVATIGLLYLLQQAVLSGYGPDARPVEAPLYFRVVFPWFGYSGYKLVVIGASVLLLLGTWAVMAKSKAGLYMRATQQDAEMALAHGVPVRRVYALVFAAGAMLAAVAGVLIVPIRQAHYLMGLDPLLLSFIVVIIGGLGSLRGTIVAAFVIGLSDGRDLDVLLAHAREDPSHPPRRAGARGAPRRPVRGARLMVGACGPPVCAFGIVTLVEAKAFDDPTLINVPLNVEPAGGKQQSGW